MAFPLIAPLPTFIPTLHPCIQPASHSSLLPSRGYHSDIRAGTGSQPWVGTGWDHSPQGLTTSRPTLAMPWHGQSTPGTLTWGAGNAHVPSVPWGHEDPQNASGYLHNSSPCCSHRKRGFHSPPQGCARRWGAAVGAAAPGCLWECSPPPAFCCQPPAAPWNPRGKIPPLPRPHRRPWAALCPCLTPTSLPPTRAAVRVPVSSAM